MKREKRPEKEAVGNLRKRQTRAKCWSAIKLRSFEHANKIKCTLDGKGRVWRNVVSREDRKSDSERLSSQMEIFGRP
jgi:hypothetical protein